MDRLERERIYKEGLELFGMECQYDQCTEEMAELMVAINKLKRQEKYGEYEGDASIKQNLLEEIADVFVCVEALSIFLDEDKMEEIIEQKMRKYERTIQKCKDKSKKEGNN